LAQAQTSSMARLWVWTVDAVARMPLDSRVSHVTTTARTVSLIFWSCPAAYTMFMLRHAARASRSLVHSSKSLARTSVRLSSRKYTSQSHHTSNDAPWAIVSAGVFGSALAYVLSINFDDHPDTGHALKVCK